MNRTFDVAVVGATGAVGEAMIEILEQRKFPVRQLYPLASSRSAGKTVRFQGRDVLVGDLAEFDFSRAQVGLFSPGASVSAVYAPKAAAAKTTAAKAPARRTASKAAAAPASS